MSEIRVRPCYPMTTEEFGNGFLDMVSYLSQQNVTPLAWEIDARSVSGKLAAESSSQELAVVVEQAIVSCDLPFYIAS